MFVIAAFGRGDQHHPPVRARQQLTVEEVRRHGIVEADLAGGDHEGRECAAHSRREFRQHSILRHPRLFMTNEHVAVSDGDDVIVEDAGIDGRGVLLREHGARVIEAMPPGDRFEGFARLPRRILLRNTRWRAVGGATVDEQFDAGRAGGWREARAICRAFVAELRCGGQRIMHREVALVSKDRAQNTRGRRRFERPVKVRDKIRRREMHSPIGGIGGRAHRCGVGDPHCCG